ncbi:hypothetical protein GCM10023336_30410 [Streptomyces similanensis]|uniref:Secreted protein n=1 Tax=Streptomyces similanensis TaxID=1274988 RepID=A0ABP9KHJ0_9ACTN
MCGMPCSVLLSLITPATAAAFSAVSRAINASPSSDVAVPARFARETQLANVVSLIPRSYETSGAGFPVSVTIRTAPSRSSAVNLRRFSVMTTDIPCCHRLHATRGTSESAITALGTAALKVACDPFEEVRDVGLSTPR